ncbi:PPOX class F420-dependent oxidoreductase [Thermopolyspora sp. NPDC052614]|uniref:PPOX class F420-dependent oxidoreductase n=1 Tax=Thermopolyspora sp. NPDC052614 TaxID=3155682 RepID=UPI0034253EAB
MVDTPEIPEGFKDLLEAGTAILATNGASGRPQVTAVAFLYDAEDGLLKISLNDTRQKTKNLRRDPKATLFIVDPQTPYRTLEIRGDAEILPDPDFSACARVSAKYNADFHVHDKPGETRSLVILHPARVVGTDMRR